MDEKNEPVRVVRSLPRKPNPNAAAIAATATASQDAPQLEFEATGSGITMSLVTAAAARQDCIEIAPGLCYYPGDPITNLSVGRDPVFVRVDEIKDLKSEEDLDQIGTISIEDKDGVDIFTVHTKG
ncbi:MAG: hypothetical protein AAF689_14680 [Pseudomonadota bacterium]